MDFYQLQSFSEYQEAYQLSVENPEKFWGTIAETHFTWRKKWDKVLEFDFTTAKTEWFKGAKLNITENCLDRHLAERGDKTALIFEPNEPSEGAQHISYTQLHKRVCQFANVLKRKGIKKGDRVCIYLPMIPELPVAMLACARIGAIHSMVFAGFSAHALAQRINDCNCSMVITSDGSYRGAKTIDLKGIVDEALESCEGVKNVLVVNRIASEITMKKNRDQWLQPLLDAADVTCEPEVMDAEDPLFILYTSGSTGTPKGMVHTTAGYMIWAAFTFKNVFQTKEEEVFWCSADIGWITGHSYIVYGPLANGATAVLFEGVPSYPDYSRFWSIVEKHKVNQFYTAPTAIRALAKEDVSFTKQHDLSSLKVIGTVGEPINEEAWHWYDDNIGNNKCPIVDTWFQTENGGIMITPLPKITPAILPMYATAPLPGVKLELMDQESTVVEGNPAKGRLCISLPWPGIARTIWGNHQRYVDTYFSTFKNQYFTGDGALRNIDGYYRITGRVDDVIIVAGHNLGTAPIEDAINSHDNVAESAIVGFKHNLKGNALYGFITLKKKAENEELLKSEINTLISKQIGPIAKLDKIQFTEGLPKTRSGKIMRRILRQVANGEHNDLGDISTLLNPETVEDIIKHAQ